MESELGEGSHFWFRISLPIASEQRPATIDKTFFAGEQVLIIDEQRIMGRSLGEWMNRWGLKATAVASINDALEQLSENLYQVVLVGEHLVYDAENPLLNHPARDTFTLFMICSITNRDFHSLGQSGPAAQLIKPIRLGNLLMKTAKALGYGDNESERPAIPARKSEGNPVVVSSTVETVGSHRILVVEDNLVNQTVAKRMLLKDGFEVGVAANGEQAVQKFTAGEPFDLIFMDCQMPRMDGYEASRQIRQFEEQRGDGVRIDREKCLDAGMDDYIAKPVKREALFEMLRRYLG
jgi:CheY-like chemotaxis protein